MLTSEHVDLDIALGPEAVLRWVLDHGRKLLDKAGRDVADLAGVGIGLPGPVEHATGRPTNPPIMPGWDGFDVPGFVTAELDCVVVVDNDVNVMALGEHFIGFPDVDHLMFVKVATGIGSGIISDGTLRRGAQGAAGDLGHIHVPHDVDAVCRCGNVGCLEAVASGAAVASQLRTAGVDAAVEPRRRRAGAGRLGARHPARPRGRAHDRRGAGERGEPAQPERDRDRRVARRGRRPAARRACARSSTGARCRSPPPSSASSRRRPATSPASSAPR